MTYHPVAVLDDWRNIEYKWQKNRHGHLGEV
jgi:hypothetical protein